MIDVFVYGTLKPGASNYSVCADSVMAIRPAIAQGHLYALPFGYPAMTPGSDVVQGVVLSFADAAILATLDEFERHDPIVFHQHMPKLAIDQYQYDRQMIEIYDAADHNPGMAWSYIMTSEQVYHLQGSLLPDGQWHPPSGPSVSPRQESSNLRHP